MKLEKAFSEDLALNITAQEADKQFAKGNIESKFSFQCPDKNCDAAVTCANLDRPKEKRKRNPYYKAVGKHSSRCDIAKNIETRKKGSRVRTDIDSDEYVDRIINLDLQPPSTKRPEPTGNIQGADDAEGRARPSNNPESGEHSIQRSKTPPSVIDDFLAKKSYPVRIPGNGVIDINDLFIEINGQDLSDFKNEFRIYYGKAWFNKKESYYSIVFDNKLTSGEITKRPSAYMSMDKAKESGFKRFKVEELENLADRTPKTVFILSETKPEVKNGYINIGCRGPEHLHYRQ